MEQTPQQTIAPVPDPDGAPADRTAPAGPRATKGGPAAIVLCLTILSVLMAGAGSLACLVTLVWAVGAGDTSLRQLVAALTFLSVGLSLGCALWALSWMVRSQFEAAVTQRRVLSLLAGAEPPPIRMPPSILPPRPSVAAPSRAQARHDEELLAAIRELSANLLLTPEEREAKRTWQQEHVGNELAQEVQSATAGGDFAKAGERLRRLATEFPADTRAGEMAEVLNAARAAVVEDDIAHAKTKAADLMALAKFQDARDVAQLLVSRYPQEPRAKALLDTVAREGDAFYGEQRNRLYGELERHVNERRWRSALATARAFLGEFPDCREAKLVAVQIQTIEDNARLEEVRDLRDRIRDCLERKRYAEALQTAREVIRRFPGTAAAGELQEQLPRLKVLAEG